MKNNMQSLDHSNESDEGQLVVFALGGEEFGVDIHEVREIVRLPEITPVPRSPEYASGICNLRGSVLPVINTRCRFDMEVVEPDEETRMLVVESHGLATGIIVDGMKEVLRLHDTSIEDTPGVCRGVDEEFLSGVVTLDKGKRLIMTLNLERILDLEIDENDESANSASGLPGDQTERDIDFIEEEQLVSFQVGSEEYAFDISAVREILRVSEITEVPNVPDYVKGLFTIRNKLMPVVDLRTLLGMKGLSENYTQQLGSMIEDHEKWARALQESLENGSEFNGELDPHLCGFGLWLDKFHTVSQDIQHCINEIRKPHGDFHRLAVSLLNSAGNTDENDLTSSVSSINKALTTVKGRLDDLRNSIDKHIHEDQRILVVENGDFTVGYLVDHVNEVIRVPKSIVNEPPAVTTTESSEIKGVAKLDEGKRLILIMDQGSILSGTDVEALSDISKKESTSSDKKYMEEDDMGNEDDEQKTLEEQSMEEEQLVTFLLDGVEYGIRIMDVQEINRLETITDVPKAPSFIDGVTNLRGNIIPVLNIRTLFGMKVRDKDDKSRIIIVNINGSKTGILVDEVNEVMRLSKADINKTPAIVAGEGNRFMDGICKIKGGQRMVTLLNTSKLLSDDELDQFAGMRDDKFAGMRDDKKKTVKKAVKKTTAKKKMKIAE